MEVVSTWMLDDEQILHIEVESIRMLKMESIQSLEEIQRLEEIQIHEEILRTIGKDASKEDSL